MGTDKTVAVFAQCGTLRARLLQLANEPHLDTFPPAPLAEVVKVSEDSAFSSQPTLRQVRGLRQWGFKTVINLSHPREQSFLRSEGVVCRSTGVDYLSLPPCKTPVFPLAHVEVDLLPSISIPLTKPPTLPGPQASHGGGASASTLTARSRAVSGDTGGSGIAADGSPPADGVEGVEGASHGTCRTAAPAAASVARSVDATDLGASRSSSCRGVEVEGRDRVPSDAPAAAITQHCADMPSGCCAKSPAATDENDIPSNSRSPEPPPSAGEQQDHLPCSTPSGGTCTASDAAVGRCVSMEEQQQLTRGVTVTQIDSSTPIDASPEMAAGADFAVSCPVVQGATTGSGEVQTCPLQGTEEWAKRRDTRDSKQDSMPGSRAAKGLLAPVEGAHEAPRRSPRQEVEPHPGGSGRERSAGEVEPAISDDGRPDTPSVSDAVGLDAATGDTGSRSEVGSATGLRPDRTSGPASTTGVTDDRGSEAGFSIAGASPALGPASAMSPAMRGMPSLTPLAGPRAMSGTEGDLDLPGAAALALPPAGGHEGAAAASTVAGAGVGRESSGIGLGVGAGGRGRGVPRALSGQRPVKAVSRTSSYGTKQVARAAAGVGSGGGSRPRGALEGVVGAVPRLEDVRRARSRSVGELGHAAAVAGLRVGRLRHRATALAVPDDEAALRSGAVAFGLSLTEAVRRPATRGEFSRVGYGVTSDGVTSDSAGAPGADDVTSRGGGGTGSPAGGLVPGESDGGSEGGRSGGSGTTGRSTSATTMSEVTRVWEYGAGDLGGRGGEEEHAWTAAWAERVLEQLEGVPKPVLLHCQTGAAACVICLLRAARKLGANPKQVHKWARELGHSLAGHSDLEQVVAELLQPKGKEASAVAATSGAGGGGAQGGVAAAAVSS